MSRPPGVGHPGHEALARIAAGEPAARDQAAHLAACAACRAALAALDPSALFALLPALPPAVAAPAYRPLAAPAAARARHPWTRAGLAAAAAGLAVLVALVAAGYRPAADRQAAPALAAAIPPIVTRVDSPDARVVTIAPEGDEGATLTLILGVEVDL